MFFGEAVEVEHCRQYRSKILSQAVALEVGEIVARSSSGKAARASSPSGENLFVTGIIDLKMESFS